MSVLVEAINVIVRKETLDQKYPGGLAAYERDCPNRTFCADDYLTRVGFMSPVDAETFIDVLTALGFVFFDGGKFVDFAVVDQTVGLTATCDWLVAEKFSDGWARCWLAGTDDVWTAFPEGRTPESVRDANLRLLTEEDSKNYEFVRYQGELTVLRHKETGRVSYTARVWNNEGRSAEEIR